MDANSFPERIKTLITLHGTVSALAKSAGISESVVRKWRDGVSEPSRDHLLALIRATGVNIAWLVAGEGPMRAGEAGQEKLVSSPPTQAPQGLAVDSEADNPRDRAPSEAAAETDLERRLTPRQRAFLGYLDELTETQQQEVMRELQETKRLNDELFEELLTKKGRG